MVAEVLWLGGLMAFAGIPIDLAGRAVIVEIGLRKPLGDPQPLGSRPVPLRQVMLGLRLLERNPGIFQVGLGTMHLRLGLRQFGAVEDVVDVGQDHPRLDDRAVIDRSCGPLESER